MIVRWRCKYARHSSSSPVTSSSHMCHIITYVHICDLIVARFIHLSHHHHTCVTSSHMCIYVTSSSRVSSQSSPSQAGSTSRICVKYMGHRLSFTCHIITHMCVTLSQMCVSLSHMCVTLSHICVDLRQVHGAPFAIHLPVCVVKKDIVDWTARGRRRFVAFPHSLATHVAP